MDIRYQAHASQYLARKMEYKVYGTRGLPCILLPAQGGRFFDCEEHGLVAAAARWVDEGRLMLFCPDCIDSEAFCGAGKPRPRIERHERWVCYLLHEFLPFVQSSGTPLLAGCGLGAAHAVNLYLRQPGLFRGVVGLSGLYDTGRFFEGSMDDLVFRNSPLRILAALPQGHPHLALYRKAAPLVLCCGQGQGQEQDALRDTRALAALLEQAQVPAWVDVWGGDVTHSWEWWAKQWTYFLEKAVFPAQREP